MKSVFGRMPTEVYTYARSSACGSSQCRRITRRCAIVVESLNNNNDNNNNNNNNKNNMVSHSHHGKNDVVPPGT